MFTTGTEFVKVSAECHTEPMETTSQPVLGDTSRRAMLRQRTVTEIKDVAVRIVERNGAAALSMREIAREMSTAPSALYRYFDGRDALLSTLIADAFDELGDVADAAIGADPGLDPLVAWTSVATSIRAWGLANPSRWGLIYGTPIPGYAADADITTQPATRITSALTRILVAAEANGHVDAGKLRTSSTQFSQSTLADVARVGTRFGFDVPPELLAEGIAAWSQLIGIISFEVFHHLAPVLADPEPLFLQQLERISSRLPFTSR
jgi:AcrR family transcriptional regulator